MKLLKNINALQTHPWDKHLRREFALRLIMLLYLVLRDSKYGKVLKQ